MKSFLKSISSYRFTFREAILIAILLHLVFLFFWQKDDIEKLELKEVKIKLGEVHMPSSSNTHKPAKSIAPKTPPIKAEPQFQEQQAAPEQNAGATYQLPKTEQKVETAKEEQIETPAVKPIATSTKPAHKPIIAPTPSLAKPKQELIEEKLATPDIKELPASMRYKQEQEKQAEDAKRARPQGNPTASEAATNSDASNYLSPMPMEDEISYGQGVRGERVGNFKQSKQETIDNYGQVLTNHINTNRFFPEKLQQMGVYGEATVEITIDKNGNLLKHRIITRTGHPALDDTAEAILRKADPYPKPPEGDARKYKYVTEIAFDPPKKKPKE